MPPIRPGMIASVSAHTVILTWGLISFGNAVPKDAPPMPALPVELLTTEEFNQITKGELKSKNIDKPRVKAEKVEPIKRDTKAEAPIAKQDVKPTATQPPKPAEAPKPEPKPEPAKAEPTPPAPKPEPPKPAEAKAPEPAPAPEKPKIAEKPPVPAPAKRPEPPKEVAKVEPKPTPKPAEEKKKPEREFSPDAISALLDKRKPSRTERAGDEISHTASAGTDTGTAQRLSVNEQAALIALIDSQIRENWNVPIGARGAGDLQVMVRFQLNPDGTLNGSPTVVNSSSNPFFSAAADAALRAVYLSAPLRDLPAKSYSDWKDVVLTLDPSQMLGG